MGSGMNLEQAKTYAEKMSYSQAVYNALCGYGIPYRKATKIKLNELLDVAKNTDARHAHWELAHEDVAYDNVWICSNCGEYFTQHRKPKFIYCPNCGAKKEK